MNDTHPEITAKLIELYQTKTPLERLEMGCSMYDTSRYLITCAILRANPTISKVAFRRELFLRFYGDDFNAEEQKDILQYLERAAQRNPGPSGPLP